MSLDELISDNSKKAKEKTETISKWLLDGSLPVDELIAFAEKSSAAEKATCIEALEFATKQNPTIADELVFSFVSNALTEEAPRIKWESAKVIGNIAHQFPAKLNKVIGPLLENARYDGTVVRWAAAYALGEIIKLKSMHSKALLPAIETLCLNEENNGVKKKYLDAIKKLKM